MRLLAALAALKLCLMVYENRVWRVVPTQTRFERDNERPTADISEAKAL